MNQEAKRDEGKLQLSLVPTQIIKDIATIRMYGNAKYGDAENWKTVEKQRYIDAFYRHWLEYIGDSKGIDEESGYPHLWHCACNMAFICEMEKNSEETTGGIINGFTSKRSIAACRGRKADSYRV